MREAYAEQVEAMAEHVDFFLIETIFDTLNAKAAIKAILDLRNEGRIDADIPIILSGTITDASGRTLSGQTTEAFYNSIRHAQPWAVSCVARPVIASRLVSSQQDVKERQDR